MCHDEEHTQSLSFFPLLFMDEKRQQTAKKFEQGLNPEQKRFFGLDAN